ncbi:MAG TPA: PQQ-dependent sugar dehydrogenase, partial [Pyrinomonadaceae bacterium]
MRSYGARLVLGLVFYKHFAPTEREQNEGRPWRIGLTIEMKTMMAAFLLSLSILALACSSPPPGRGAGEVENSPQSQTSFKVETVVGNLEVPWSIVWAPDGRMIFTERPGRVRVVQNGKLQSQPLFVVPDVDTGGETGLMSVALHPQFQSNRFVYLSYGYTTNGEFVRVVRYRETPNGFTDRKIILENIPSAQFHAG